MSSVAKGRACSGCCVMFDSFNRFNMLGFDTFNGRLARPENSNTYPLSVWRGRCARFRRKRKASLKLGSLSGGIAEPVSAHRSDPVIP